ncbi:MAG TPA: c-type cytochrome [Chitinophagaceae bacterium]|nr:c-type cytochrome [Chitinophagaceae bacterium]
MKRFKKILKWTGVILLLLISGLTITVMSRQNLVYDRPYPAVTASTDSAVILKGKALVFGAAHCADCHGKNNSDSLLSLGIEPSMSGGHVFDLPIGKIYARNITPDKETGIGNLTDAEIARTLRYGVYPDGTTLFDFMPFHNMADEDLGAIISYLRAQKPVVNKVPNNAMNPMGMVIKAFLMKPAGPTMEVPVSIKPDTTVAYGQYLANSVANCGGCHTRRDVMTGAFIGEPFEGGLEIEGFITPNLSPDSSSRIFGWTQQHFLERFRKGKLIPGTPMPWNSFKRMSDGELKAIYKYLQTVKPVKTKPV